MIDYGDTVVSLKNISIKNPYDGSYILQGVTFNIGAGDFVYIVGKTGSGKSTFLRSLYADLDFKGDEAIVVGVDILKIRDRDIPALRRKLGIIFQDFQLLEDRDVDSNLDFVLRATGWKDKQKIENRKKEVLDMVDLGTKVRFRKTYELSGGERQRIVIARALLNSPKLIIADEPTGNLDPETAKGIMSLLFDIKEQGTTVIMATHNYSLFGNFPAKILKCQDGKIMDSNFNL